MAQYFQSLPSDRRVALLQKERHVLKANLTHVVLWDDKITSKMEMQRERERERERERLRERESSFNGTRN